MKHFFLSLLLCVSLCAAGETSSAIPAAEEASSVLETTVIDTAKREAALKDFSSSIKTTFDDADLPDAGADVKAALDKYIQEIKSGGDAENARKDMLSAVKNHGVSAENVKLMTDAVDSICNGETCSSEKTAEICDKVMTESWIESQLNNMEFSSPEERDKAKKELNAMMSGTEDGDQKETDLTDEQKKLLEKFENPENMPDLKEQVKDLQGGENTTTPVDKLSDALQNKISEVLPDKVAKEINKVIEKNLTAGKLSKAGYKEVEKILKKHGLDDKATLEAAQKVVDGVFNGTVTKGDFNTLGKELGRSYLYNKVDQLNISDDEKEYIKNMLAANNLSELGDAALENIVDVLTGNKISQEKVNEIASDIRALITAQDPSDRQEAFKNLGNEIKAVAAEQIAKAIDKQLNKLTQKYPILKTVFDSLGINAQNIENFLKNLTWEQVKSNIKKIMNMNWESFKNFAYNLGSKLLGCLTELAQEYITKLLNKFFDLIQQVLNKFAQQGTLQKYLAQLAGAGVAAVKSTVIKDVNKAVETVGQKWQDALNQRRTKEDKRRKPGEKILVIPGN